MLKKPTLLLYRLAQAKRPLTSREVAEAIQIDYRRNFNKREARYAKKLAPFIVRVKPTDVTNAPKVLHWSLADQWKGQRVFDIVKAYLQSQKARDFSEIAQ